VATALENLVDGVLALMNQGATLDEIIHTVKVPDSTLARPFLRPFYDEPEFVVRNVYRLYGGWWDGDPASLKPAPAASLGAEIARLAGGALPLVRRALAVADEGDLRLACHLAELAGAAAPDDGDVHVVRAEVYRRRRDAERSLMAKGIFSSAIRQSEAVVNPAVNPAVKEPS
jgi:alkyl sulfatase BDS1-like metallo-beta-lactamase superfamily hydrolase